MCPLKLKACHPVSSQPGLLLAPCLIMQMPNANKWFADYRCSHYPPPPHTHKHTHSSCPSAQIVVFSPLAALEKRTWRREGDNTKLSKEHHDDLSLWSKIKNTQLVIIIRHVPDLKTWRSALMLLQPRMSPGFQDLSESNRGGVCVMRMEQEAKLRKQAPGEGEPVTVVTRLWIWGGTSVRISSIPCLRVHHVFSGQSQSHEEIAFGHNTLLQNVFLPEACFLQRASSSTPVKVWRSLVSWWPRWVCELVLCISQGKSGCDDNEH